MGRLSIALLLLALAPPAASALSPPLLENGLFTEAADGIPTGWRVEAWQREHSDVSWEPIEGGGVVRIVNREANDTRLCQSMPVVAGATYRVSARVRTQNVGSTTAGAMIALEPRITDSPDLKGTQDWQVVQVTAQNAEASSWDVCLRLGSYANLNTGTAWFTDVRVDQVSGPPPLTGTRWSRLLEKLPLAAWRATPWTETGAPLVGGLLLALGLGIVGRRPR
jgi:hypothetical protein